MKKIMGVCLSCCCCCCCCWKKSNDQPATNGLLHGQLNDKSKASKKQQVSSVVPEQAHNFHHQKQEEIKPEKTRYNQLICQQDVDSNCIETINFDFQNSLDDSELSQFGKLEINHDRQLRNNGLPNIGNTCYLNSVLQFLYAAQKIRKIVLKTSNDRPNLKLYGLVAAIFQDINNNESDTQKKKHLKQLISYLTEKQDSIKLYLQNDAIQLLHCLLNLMDDEDSDGALIDKFKVKYELRCKCNAQEKKLNIERHIITSGIKCQRCNEKYQYNVLNSRCFLLVQPSSDSVKFHEYIKFNDKARSTLYFENKAFLNYYGNSQSGHYIAHRKTPSGWLQISDSSVKNVGMISGDHLAGVRLTLYEFRKRILKK